MRTNLFGFLCFVLSARMFYYKISSFSPFPVLSKRKK